MVHGSVPDTASARKVVEFQIQELEDQVGGAVGSLGSFRADIEERIADLKAQLNVIGTRFENLSRIDSAVMLRLLAVIDNDPCSRTSRWSLTSGSCRRHR